MNVHQTIGDFLTSVGSTVSADGVAFSFLDADANPREVNIHADDTIQSFMSRVNNQVPGVNMGFDSVRGVFTISSSGVGANATVRTDDMTGLAADFFTAIGLNGISDTATGGAHAASSQRAQNAIIYWDTNTNGTGGLRVEGTSASNTINVDGTMINVSAAAVGETFTVNNVTDVEDTISAIREFIDNYNTLLRYLNTLHTTPRPTSGGHRNFFNPLTDDERSGMSEAEVKRWEEQAQLGLFHRDQDIRNLHTDLRSAMFADVVLADGSRLNITQLGITSARGSGADQNIGLLELNAEGEAQLRKMLEENPDRVQAFFSQSNHHAGGNDPQGRSARSAGQGLAFRVDDILEGAVGRASGGNGMSGTLRQRVGVAGEIDGINNRMSQQIREYDDRIEQMRQWLLRRENHFFAMFARMENAMSESHSQMDALWMFGSM